MRKIRIVRDIFFSVFLCLLISGCSSNDRKPTASKNENQRQMESTVEQSNRINQSFDEAEVVFADFLEGKENAMTGETSFLVGAALLSIDEQYGMKDLINQYVEKYGESHLSVSYGYMNGVSGKACLVINIDNSALENEEWTVRNILVGRLDTGAYQILMDGIENLRQPIHLYQDGIVEVLEESDGIGNAGRLYYLDENQVCKSLYSYRTMEMEALSGDYESWMNQVSYAGIEQFECSDGYFYSIYLENGQMDELDSLMQALSQEAVLQDSTYLPEDSLFQKMDGIMADKGYEKGISFDEVLLTEYPLESN